jgi:hypothetical protein
MYAIRVTPLSSGLYLGELLRNGDVIDSKGLHHEYLEHAEAEAASHWRQAGFCNSIDLNNTVYNELMSGDAPRES